MCCPWKVNKDLDEQVRLLGAVNLCMASEPAELHVLFSVDSEAGVSRCPR